MWIQNTLVTMMIRMAIVAMAYIMFIILSEKIISSHFTTRLFSCTDLATVQICRCSSCV